MGFTVPWAGATPFTQVGMKEKMRRFAPVELLWAGPNSARSVFCVILSVAKDLDGRSDDRRQLRAAIKSAKDQLVALGVYLSTRSLLKGARFENDEVPLRGRTDAAACTCYVDG